jgi:hypothetical protein
MLSSESLDSVANCYAIVLKNNPGSKYKVYEMRPNKIFDINTHGQLSRTISWETLV